MNEMIDQVAKVLLASEFSQFPNIEQFIEDNWVQFSDVMKETYRFRARKAIEVMCEPTESMRDVAPIKYHDVTANGQVVGVNPYLGDGPIAAYKRMMAEALK